VTAHRVVITGLGCISPLGNTATDVWDAMKAGQCGIAPFTSPDPRLVTKLIGEVKNFEPKDHFDDRQINMMDRFSQFAVVAAREAVADSGLEFDEDLRQRTACIVGTGMGGMTTLEDGYYRFFARNMHRINPLTVPRVMPSAACSQVSMELGTTGPAFCTTSACASSNHAFGEALWMIRTGRVDAALAGGTEASLSFGCLRSWDILRVMAPDACRPFCKDRRGMVIAEGAGIAVMESLEHAQARGAKIYAELAGFGYSADAGDLVQPSDIGAARAMNACLEDAGMKPEQIGYINAHGTGTIMNDVAESKAIHRVFGAHTAKVAVSSTKSQVGHGLGAAGALEMIAAARAVSEGILPPTVNFTEADPKCELDHVANEARTAEIEGALTNSFAFGGLNAVLALRKVH